MQLISSQDFDFANYMRDSELTEKVRPAKDYEDDIKQAFALHDVMPGVGLPFSKTFKQIRFQQGEVSVWAGINGHGKSSLLSQVVAHMCRSGERACIASFEMKPYRTLAKMVKQYASRQYPTPSDIGDFMHQVDNKLWLYDQQGTVKQEVLYGVVKYCANELGIRQFVIDNLMKCVRGSDDYNGQKDFIDTITSIARDFQMHIHVVHHIKKLSSEELIPGKFDTKGAGEISDMVDNLFICWRNKKKEKDPAKFSAEPDSLLICEKQRNWQYEGIIKLWYDKSCEKYHEEPI